MVKHNWTARCAHSPDRPTKQPGARLPKRVGVVFLLSQDQVWADGIHMYVDGSPFLSQPKSVFVFRLKLIPEGTLS